jgi:AraC-like DNA-binding protein
LWIQYDMLSFTAQIQVQCSLNNMKGLRKCEVIVERWAWPPRGNMDLVKLPRTAILLFAYERRQRLTSLPVADRFNTSEHIRIFGVLPRFAAYVNAVEFDAAALSQPLLTADPALSRIIERHAEASLGSVGPASESTTEKVRRILVKALPESPCSITTVAPRLGLSERTLQRRLESEGSTFGEVLDGVRRDLGLRYLEDGKLTLAEIAYLLGYSEPSPFYRAFKRWTGSTPQSLRYESKRRPVK